MTEVGTGFPWDFQGWFSCSRLKLLTKTKNQPHSRKFPSEIVQEPVGLRCSSKSRVLGVGGGGGSGREDGTGQAVGEGRSHKFPAFHGAKEPVISPVKATLGAPQRPSQRLPSD